MKYRGWAGTLVALAACGALVPACDEDTAIEDENIASRSDAIRNGQNRDIDIVVLGGSDLTCGGETCFFIGADKNISHVWVKAEGCEPGDFEVEIDGHAAGPAEAGPPDCNGFGGVRYVTGGRNPTAVYFDTRTVCVRFAEGVEPGRVAVQAKASATCEDRSVGEGSCRPCDGEGGAGGAGGKGGGDGGKGEGGCPPSTDYPPTTD